MAWRKWLVRGLVFLVLGCLSLGGILYRFWTRPAAIRSQVLSRLQKDFIGIDARLGSAHFSLFGGITIQDLRIARSNDLEKSDFLYVPSATLYHDKQQFFRGSIAIHKIELHRPQLRAIRKRDGSWNLSGLIKPGETKERLPTLVVHEGTLLVEDKQAALGTPPLEVTNVNLTMINDPPAVVVVEGSGNCPVLGPVRLRGRAQRGGPLTLEAEANSIRVGPDLLRRLAGNFPDLAEHARHLRGQAKLQGTLHYNPQTTPALQYTLKGVLERGEFRHESLPEPLQNLKGSFRCVNGVIPEAELQASSGPIRLQMRLRDLTPVPNPSSLADLVQELHVKAEHIPVKEELFNRLPDWLKQYQRDYSPEGEASVVFAFRRLEQGRWRQHWIIQGHGMKARYAYFRYPVEDIHGTLDLVMTGQTSRTDSAASRAASIETPCGHEENILTIDLRGQASGQPMNMKGEVKGHGDQYGYQIEIWGENVPIDRQLLAALPQTNREVAESFEPSGLLDYRVSLHQEVGQKPAHRYFLQMHDGSVRYKAFPLPLQNVSSTLEILPEHWEFRDFLGHHQGGQIRARGRSIAESNSNRPPADQRASVTIQGIDLPLDEPFRKALGTGRETLAKAWDAFAVTGKMSFVAHIEELPNQPQDIDVTVSVNGCRMEPTFFRYVLDDVSATVRYAKGTARMARFQGRHGKSTVQIDDAVAFLKPAGGFWAKLDKLRVDSLLLDSDFLRAIPAPLRKGFQAIQLRQPIDLDTLLILDMPAEGSFAPTVYWDGTADLRNATVLLGVAVSGITGEISCRGLHNGQQLEGVAGNVLLESATVFNQPLRRVHMPLAVWKDSPDILRLPDFKANLFGGHLLGEGRVEFGSIFRYELVLKASQLKLEEFGKHNLGKNSELSGLVNAALHLTGEGGDLSGLKGNGKVDVPNGKLYRLPLLLDLLKWLGLRLPDRTAFEQANTIFNIEGPRVNISKLDLYGNAISVRGQGTMNLDGSNLNLDLHADWGRLSQILPSSVNALTREISNQLLKIKVRGRVDDVRFEQELVPIVTDPLKKVWNELQKEG